MRTLNDKDQKLAMTHRDSLAVFCTIMIVNPYLEGTGFTVRRNHKALLWIRNMFEASEELVHSKLQMSEFDVDIIYCAVPA